MVALNQAVLCLACSRHTCSDAAWLKEEGDPNKESTHLSPHLPASQNSQQLPENTKLNQTTSFLPSRGCFMTKVLVLRGLWKVC